MSKHQNWGGKRAGSGQKPKWKMGETKPLRLPVALHDKVLEYARMLDESEGKLDYVTSSKENNDYVTLSSKLAGFMEKWGDGIDGRTSPRWAKAKVMVRELQELLNESSTPKSL